MREESTVKKVLIYKILKKDFLIILDNIEGNLQLYLSYLVSSVIMTKAVSIYTMSRKL